MPHWTQHEVASLSDEAWRTPAKRPTPHDYEAGHRTEHFLVPARCLHLLQRPTDPQLRAIELLSRCRVRICAGGVGGAGDFGRLTVRYRDRCGDPRGCERLLNSLLMQRKADAGARLQPLRATAAVAASDSATAADAVEAARIAGCVAIAADDILRGSTFVHCCGIAYAAFAEIRTPAAVAPAPAVPALRVCNCVRLQLLDERAVAFDAAGAEFAGSADAAESHERPFAAATAASSSTAFAWRLCGPPRSPGAADDWRRCPAAPVMCVAGHQAAAVASLAPIRVGAADQAEATVAEAMAIVRAPPTTRAAPFGENHQLPTPPPVAADVADFAWPEAAAIAEASHPPVIGASGSHFLPSVDPRRRLLRPPPARPDYLGDSRSIGSTEMLTHF